MVVFGISETGSSSTHFFTERVLDATRLAAVVVVNDERPRREPPLRERARAWWRRLLDRARLRVEMRAQAAAHARTHPRADAQYDPATREVRLLGQRWRVPGDGELALVLRVDRPDGAGATPVVTTRTVPAPTVPTEPIRVDPSASRERQRAQVTEIVRRNKDAQSRAWGAALLADPEAAELVGRRLLESMVKGR